MVAKAHDGAVDRHNPEPSANTGPPPDSRGDTKTAHVEHHDDDAYLCPCALPLR